MEYLRRRLSRQHSRTALEHVKLEQPQTCSSHVLAEYWYSQNVNVQWCFLSRYTCLIKSLCARRSFTLHGLAFYRVSLLTWINWIIDRPQGDVAHIENSCMSLATIIWCKRIYSGVFLQHVIWEYHFTVNWRSIRLKSHEVCRGSKFQWF